MVKCWSNRRLRDPIYCLSPPRPLARRAARPRRGRRPDGQGRPSRRKPKGAVKPLPSKLPGPSPLDPQPETKPAEAPLTAPPPEVCKRLVTATLLSFNRAVQSKSFTAFHIESLSKPFADAYPADKLLETFQPFISAGANLGGVEAVDPEFDPAPVVENNLLKLKGVYRTRPMLVLFDFDYANEAGDVEGQRDDGQPQGHPAPDENRGRDQARRCRAAIRGGAGQARDRNAGRFQYRHPGRWRV